MKTVQYYHLKASWDKKESTLIDFLLMFTYLMREKIIPPKLIINKLLSKGFVDAGMGMGYRWDHFELDDSEFHELLQGFNALSDGYRFINPDPWVKNYIDWIIWKAEVTRGIPSDTFRKFFDELIRQENVWKAAEEGGNVQEINMAYQKFKEADNEISKFISKYVNY